MENDITDFFRNLIAQTGSYDIAKAEFEHLVDDDPELRVQYAQWCEEQGYSQRNGFNEFCKECMDSHDSVWESLNDFDE